MSENGEQKRTFKTNEPLVKFFYLLLRDELPFGVVERLIEESENAADKGGHLSNHQLGYYAKSLAKRLEKKK